MKILFFSSYFSPETMAASFRATENSKIWNKMGHDVTVFTGYPNYPLGKIFDGYVPKLLTIEDFEGIKIIRSKMIAKPNTSIINRLENALSYCFYGLYNILINKNKIVTNYDVVLGSSGVIFNALLAKIYAFLYRKPFVLEIRDITYKQMIASGKKEKGISVRLMKCLELFLCNKADKVVVVSNGYKKILSEEGVPSNKFEVITNGVDVKSKLNDSSNTDKFTLSYFGTLGLSQNISQTFKYAEVLSKMISNFQYLIIGDGAEKKVVTETAANYSFSIVKPILPPEQLEADYKETQLSIIALKKSGNFQYTIPVIEHQCIILPICNGLILHSRIEKDGIGVIVYIGKKRLI